MKTLIATALITLCVFAAAAQIPGVDAACDCYTAAFTPSSDPLAADVSVDVTVDGVTTTHVIDKDFGVDVALAVVGEETIAYEVSGQPATSVTLACQRDADCLDPTANVAALVAQLEARFEADSVKAVADSTDVRSREAGLAARIVADSTATVAAAADASAAGAAAAAASTAASAADAKAVSAQGAAATVAADLAAAETAIAAEIASSTVGATYAARLSSTADMGNVSGVATTLTTTSASADFTESGGVLTVVNPGVYNVRATAAATYNNRLSLLIDIEVDRGDGSGFVALIPRREGYMARNASHNDASLAAETEELLAVGDRLRIRVGSRRDGSGTISLNSRSILEVTRLGDGA